MKTKIKFSTTQIIALGFLGLILVGSFLLMLPISSNSGQWTSFVDALFMATTSTCVTGLVTVNTLAYWSTFGHVVILCLIQLGGLGVVTFSTMFLMIIGQRISLHQRMVIQDSYNLDTLKGLVNLTRKIVIGTFVVETAGALIYMVRFIPLYGVGQGIWRSFFTAVSAFCNAGIDLIGTNSMEPFVGDVLINITTMFLIIVAGLGFPVWWDVIKTGKKAKQDQRSHRGFFKRLSLQSKIVLSMTSILIFVGAIFFFIMEYNNPATMGNLAPHEKVMASFFQSVTLRTAGFQTVAQEGLTTPSQLISLIWMFIGGSPSGTAGGVKTVTIVVIILSVFAILRNNKDTEIFSRKLSDSMLRKALAVFGVSFCVLMLSIISLSIVMPNANIMDIIYESTSAIGTVGLSRNFTGTLNIAGKLIITLTMYLGRIGPISLALAFNASARDKKAGRHLPEEKITVG